LSHLETRIRRIESDLEKQRNLVQSITTSPNTIENNTDEHNRATAAKDLSSKVIKTEMEVQDSRSILAQLRLRGEQRISRNKRAAATTASPTPESITRTPSSSILAKQAKLKSNNSSNTKQPNLKSTSNRTNSHAKFNHQSSTATTTIDNTLLYASCNYETTSNNKGASLSPSFYFQGMMLAPYDHPPPPGHGMDWTLFDQDSQKQQIELVYHPHHTSKIAQQEQAINDLFTPDYNSMFQDMSASPTSTRSSSLVSHLGGGYPATLHPSNSTGSTASNMTGLSSTTSCSSINTCDNNIFNFSMDDIMLQSSSNLMESGQQGIYYYINIEL
jgi:hypothetical protein